MRETRQLEPLRWKPLFDGMRVTTSELAPCACRLANHGSEHLHHNSLIEFPGGSAVDKPVPSIECDRARVPCSHVKSQLPRTMLARPSHGSRDECIPDTSATRIRCDPHRDQLRRAHLFGGDAACHANGAPAQSRDEVAGAGQAKTLPPACLIGALPVLDPGAERVRGLCEGAQPQVPPLGPLIRGEHVQLNHVSHVPYPG
jgi:hypothetical protein